ncbi:hypothetical protein BU26DRAFT_525126 [Trematosphaeria pertusa]|uniref:Transcription factor domain-containing protein n=1 Tax=Trematosphaeria pertusa TaxID=390896 RepID=A0A6A6HU47_9PLEO|nr:uncharacterized protein BU26DRAFT_525126 [Trematosphaeria pertusa]KAF2241626.1 hypothetical protein BU26DRAFT_525126 [Trematosphaeria pertusa]
MDSRGSQDSGPVRSRRSTKQPMQFMFIDSTDHGVNAKPDKAVRSFVMKTARRQKPWSTRQKSPKTEAELEENSQPRSQQSSTRTYDGADEHDPASPGSWQEFAPTPSARYARSRGSAVSSRNGTFSRRPSSHLHLLPPSSRVSVCDFPHCTGDSCGQPHEAPTALGRRCGFDVGFRASFDCLPVQMDEKMRDLLENFVNAHSALLIPLDRHQASKPLTTEWVANSILSASGAPFIYAVLTSSALYSQATGAANPLDVLHYKTETIREIHTLFDNPRRRVDDSNIAAVFMLLCLEESQLVGREDQEDAEWSELQRRKHLNGLKKMIELRGGLAALGRNRCLQTFILMHSIAHAVTTFERPYTTLVDATGQTQQYDIPSFRSRPSSGRTLRLFQALKLEPALFDIVSNAVVFIGDLTCWFEEGKSPVSPLELQKHVCLLMYRLFDWYKQGEEDRGIQRNPVDQSICLALLIFLVRAYEDSYLGMVHTAGSKLEVCLGRCVLRWGKAPDLLMWTLTMGALATQGTTEFAFFKRYCGVAFADQGFNEFTNAEELLDRMRKCLWLPKLDEEVKRLWAHIGFCKGEEVMETIETGPTSPKGIKDNEVVGSLTSNRFFGRRSDSQ